MGFEMISNRQIQQKIDEEVEYHEVVIETLEQFKRFTEEGHTVFYNEETDQWFLIIKGMPLPKNLEPLVLRG